MVQLRYDKLFPDITKFISEKNKKTEANGVKSETEKDDFLEGFNYYSNEEKKEKEELSRYRTLGSADLSSTTPPSSYTIPSSVTPTPPKDTEEKDEFLEGFSYYDDGKTEQKEAKKEFSMITPQAKNPLKYSPLELLQSNNGLFAIPKSATATKNQQKEKSGWEKFLDGASYALTAASAIPVLDTFTNVAQIPVDLLRKDWLGAGLDLVGVIPFVGEIGDGGKYVHTADKVIDGVRAADKVADSIRTADSVKVADEVAENIIAAEKARDAAKTAEKIEDIIDVPNIHYPGDDPTISPGKDFEWRGKADPGTGNGAWYNPKTGESMHWDLNHADPIGPHWDYIDPNGNRFRVFKDGRVEFSGK